MNDNSKFNYEGGNIDDIKRQLDIEIARSQTKEETLAQFEKEERQRHGGSGKMRNPMNHLQPKKKKRKK